jgi:hypothetical protein
MFFYLFFFYLKNDKLRDYHYEIWSFEVIDLTPNYIIKYFALHSKSF